MFDPKDSAQLRRIIAEYRQVRSDYELLAGYLKQRLAEIAKKLEVYPIVMSRAKSLESLAEKVQRKSYDDPLSELTDLCGVRVITHTLDEVDLLAAAAKAEFELDLKNSEDKQAKLAFREFGYLSKHYIIQLKDTPQIEGISEETLSRLSRLKAELQLRTLAQHIWADIYHELGYKNEFKLPSRWEREFARLAALLEDSDKGFQEIKDAMSTYQSSYSAYMTTEQLKALAYTLESLLAVDASDVRAIHRLIRVRLALKGGEDKIREILHQYRPSLESYPPALRDIGVAYCRVNPPGTEGFSEGQSYLGKAIELDPRDVDARCSLGGTCRKRARDLEAQGKTQEAENWYRQALDCYRDAHRRDPTNPYPLGNYIAELLRQRKDLSLIEHFHSAIQRCMDRCKKQVEVKVNLPWALFDLGIFSLYLGSPFESFCHYAKGIANSTDSWMISSAEATIADLMKLPGTLQGIAWVDKLLRLGFWSRASDEEKGKSGWRPAGRPVRWAGPILALAGGCENMEARHRSQLELLREALKTFYGTLVSGGTTSGIAGVAGDLQEKADPERPQTIGYVPAEAAPGLKDQIDRRYTVLRHTEGADFSPLEPLAFWEDLFTAGVDPREVKLIGFNGGRIAACEYRMALAFGARVGIVSGSGREADALLADPLWKGSESLHVLGSSDDIIQWLKA